MTQEQLHTIIQSEAEATGFSGTVFVKNGTHAAVSGAYGYASKADTRPNRPDTRYGHASGSKLFTAIAVCQLVEQGKLALDSKIMDILEQEEFPRFSSDITVHHLLTH
ncbi:penicillin-binding protein, partial [Paenibacillus riograndensis]